MLSLSNGGMSASHAGHYFAVDDYYLKGGEPSRWLGKGAAELGLEGKVEERDFINVINGRSPDGTEQLVAPKVTHGSGGARIENHRAGNDLTFSAPKSVSIGYAAGNRELKEIWDQAVVNTMCFVENHYSHYRTPGGVETAGNIVAAKFDHVTSRSLDPEIHSHVFLVNMVRGSEGNWLANEPKNIYQDKIFLGMLCRQEAIYLYRQSGYGITITDPDALLFEIKGVGRELIEHFSKRSQDIGERVAVWKREGKFPGVTDAVLKQMAALDTRDPKQKVLFQDVQRGWERDLAAAGTSAAQVKEEIELVRKNAPAAHFRYLPPADYPVTMATVVPHTNLVKLKRQEGYQEAKERGDIHAARDIVDALVKPDRIEEIMKMIPAGRPLYVIPVGRKVEGNLNMLPVAYAEKLAEELGGKVWTDIAKVAGASNTGKSLNERFKNIQIFRGALPPKDSIIILTDDTLTVGGTVAALTDHLAQGGHVPLCVTVLASGKYGKRLIPTEREINGLLRKTGLSAEEFDREFGYHPRFLTGTEIRSYLRYGGRGIAGARARFYSSRDGKSPGHPAPHPETKEQKSPGEIVKDAARFLTDKEAVFDRTALLKTTLQLSKGAHPINELNESVRIRNALFFIGHERQGWQAGREYWTTDDMLRLEASNLADLKALPPFSGVTSRAEVGAYLKGLSGRGEGALSPDELHHQEAFRIGAESAARSGAVELTAGQRAYVLNELAGAGAFGVTQGDPGTGKTFSSGVVERFNAEVLEPSGRVHHTINIAYTGKAALEMEKASGSNAQTIHSFFAQWTGSDAPAALFGIRKDDKAQTVLKVDEASFVGGRQAHDILKVVRELRSEGYRVKLALIGDSKQMQSIQASPFFIHASQLAREGQGEWTVMKEITRQKNPDLRDVARTLNQDVPQLGANAVAALKMLEQQERVTEIPERKELVKAVVEEYLSEASKPAPDPARAAAGERQSVLVVTPLHADRRDLNQSIREARLQRGELAGGKSVQVLAQVEQGVTAAPYQPGMILVLTPGEVAFCQEGVRRKGEGVVVAADMEHNTVNVQFLKGEPVTFEASQLALSSSLYRKEEKDLAVGDQVVFGRNTRRGISPADGGENSGVRNSERGTIEELNSSDGSTTALVRLAGGRKVLVELERLGPQQIDYGYAITVPKGQGETVDKVLSFHYVKPGPVNEQNVLASVTGRNVTAEEFSRWNTTLTESEISYRTDTVIGRHAGSLSFIMLSDTSLNAGDQKGIAVRFKYGQEVISDEQVRLQMREAGMYWAPEAGAWVTAATNREFLSLPGHPLRDQGYLAQLKESLSPGAPPAVSSPASQERNYRAELQTLREAERFGRTSFNAFNVAVTRARHDAHVFTNSVSGLRQAIQQVDQKSSTVRHPLLTGRASEIRRAIQQPLPQPKPAASISQPKLQPSTTDRELKLTFPRDPTSKT